MKQFYVHFATAYGTFWLALMSVAIVSQSHVDAGEFGLFGFPIIAAIYAMIRVSQSKNEGSPSSEVRWLRDRVAALEEQRGPADPDVGVEP